MLDQAGGQLALALAPLQLPEHLVDLLSAIDGVDDPIHSPYFVAEHQNGDEQRYDHLPKAPHIPAPKTAKPSTQRASGVDIIVENRRSRALERTILSVLPSRSTNKQLSVTCEDARRLAKRRMVIAQQRVRAPSGRPPAPVRAA